MNIENLRGVIQAYLDNFNMINNEEHREYYKWEAFKCFKDNWDIEAENFEDMFKSAMRLTSNLINNSRVSPTNGIIKLAERPELKEIIRGLFKDLYADDEGNIDIRQKKIEDFRDKVNELLDKYEPGKWKYTQEFRTVMFYLNMHNPSENYLYKATEAREFMYCTEFGDDFGSGQSFNLRRYYKMCDELLAEIKNTPELVESHKERIKDSMIVDDDFHILAFDIIYCAVTYGLYSGIKIKRPVKRTTAKQRKNARIEELQAELSEALNQLNVVLVERAELSDIAVVGLKIQHKKFGEGTVTSQDGNIINVRYEDDEKKFSLPTAFSDGYLKCAEEEVVELFTKQDDLDKQIKTIKSKALTIEMQLKSLGISN